MSSPTDIEVVATPAWMEEGSKPKASSKPKTPKSKNKSKNGSSSPSWMEEGKPNSTDIEGGGEPTWLKEEKVIHAPSKAAKASKAAKSSKEGKSDAKKLKTDGTKAKKTKISKTTEKNNNDNLNVNTGADNNGENNNLSAAEAASQKTWSQYFKESFQRDGRLYLIMLAIIIVINIPFIRWVLYPFTIFSTWIHELCHGLAALMVGGRIVKLEIFPDGSGLATSALPDISRRGFVSSAGYQGTAFWGFMLLIFRRTKRGPRTGTMALACTMLLSCVIWIRNVFGFFFIFGFGLVLAVLAWFLPSFHIRNVYVCLAVTVSMNAITSVHDLFGLNQYVNGVPMSTDAHTMAELKGGSYMVWAILWFILAIVMTILGIVFAIPGPDEVADFACCGVCQDLGCFTLCNYPGQRCLERFRRGNNNNGDTGNNNEIQESE